MRQITNPKEIEKTEHYMKIAAIEALNSDCKKSQRGAVIVKDEEIIGKGFNLPLNKFYCDPCIRENIQDHSQVELCSAIHAEELAISNVPRNKLVNESTMYHIKVKDSFGRSSGRPSCPPCAKSIFNAGIKELVLFHKEGYFAYSPSELLSLSLDYFLKKD